MIELELVGSAHVWGNCQTEADKHMNVPNMLKDT